MAALEKTAHTRVYRAPQVQALLRKAASVQRAAITRKFFKTTPGAYGHGDVFIGVTVPDIRRIVRISTGLGFTDIKRLVCSRVHEDRLAGLLILVAQFQDADNARQSAIFKWYCAHTRYVNSWDLVDATAAYIVGAYVFDKKRDILYERARSLLVWDRRIAIVATHYFIRRNEVRDTFALARILIQDTHALIHKATGWMLREAGKRDMPALKKFLAFHCRSMPRVALRYALEHFDAPERARYMRSSCAVRPCARV